MITTRRFLNLLLPLVIFLTILIFLWVGLYRNPRIIPSPLLNKPIPEFQAKTIPETARLLTNQNFIGKVTILNVFATWCTACQAEHSVWIESRHDLKNAQIIGLSYKDSSFKVMNWLKQYGNPYDQIIDDPQGQIGINLGVYGTPETFIIDRQGIIRYKFIGAVSSADWETTLLPEVQKYAA